MENVAPFSWISSDFRKEKSKQESLEVCEVRSSWKQLERDWGVSSIVDAQNTTPSGIDHSRQMPPAKRIWFDSKISFQINFQ